MATSEEFADEARRARKVRHIVDIATSLIMQSKMTRCEAEQLVAEVRRRILALFPDGEETYELIYYQRFRRLMDEFTVPEPTHRAVVIGFPEPRH